MKTISIWRDIQKTFAFSKKNGSKEKSSNWQLAISLLRQSFETQMADLISFNAGISACETWNLLYSLKPILWWISPETVDDIVMLGPQ